MCTRQVTERSKRTRSIEENARARLLYLRRARPRHIFRSKCLSNCNSTRYEAKRVREHRERVPRNLQGSRWRESSRSSSHRRSRFDARDEQLDLFVVRICPTVRLTLPPPPYCTFKKILSKFCSSDILIF